MPPRSAPTALRSGSASCRPSGNRSHRRPPPDPHIVFKLPCAERSGGTGSACPAEIASRLAGVEAKRTRPRMPRGDGLRARDLCCYGCVRGAATVRIGRSSAPLPCGRARSCVHDLMLPRTPAATTAPNCRPPSCGRHVHSQERLPLCAAGAARDSPLSSSAGASGVSPAAGIRRWSCASGLRHRRAPRLPALRHSVLRTAVGPSIDDQLQKVRRGTARLP